MGLALVNLLAYLAYTGVLSRLVQWVGGAHVDGVNRAYLDAASHHASELLELLSASKGILAVLKSSEGGISFIVDVQIQLGQSLIVMYDAIDRAWLFSVAALSSIEVLRLLLDLSHYTMAPVLTLFFCLFGIDLALRRRIPMVAEVIAKLAKFTLFTVIVVHVVVPLSLYGAAALGQGFFAAHKAEIHRGFSALHAGLPKHDYQVGLKAQVKGSVQQFKERQGALHQTTPSLNGLTARHMVFVVVEFVVIPLLILLALSAVTLRLLRRCRE